MKRGEDGGGNTSQDLGAEAATGEASEEAPTEVVELGPLNLHEARSPSLKNPRVLEDTRARLAFALVILIGLVILGLFILIWARRIDSDEFEKLAGLMLAPLVGLLGAATGYYYGRTGKS